METGSFHLQDVHHQTTALIIVMYRVAHRGFVIGLMSLALHLVMLWSETVVQMERSVFSTFKKCQLGAEKSLDLLEASIFSSPMKKRSSSSEHL